MPVVVIMGLLTIRNKQTALVITHKLQAHEVLLPAEVLAKTEVNLRQLSSYYCMSFKHRFF